MLRRALMRLLLTATPQVYFNENINCINTMPKNLYYLNRYLVGRFSKSLTAEGFSKATIKNYLTDINQFLRWRDKSHRSLTDEQLLSEYSCELKKTFRVSSIKRKLSAVGKYIAFESQELSLLPKRHSPAPRISYTPLLVGVFLMLAVPAIGQGLDSRTDIAHKENMEAEIPANIKIYGTQKADIYTLDTQKGLRIVLAEEPIDAKEVGKSPAFIMADALNTNPKLTSEGSAVIYKGRSETILANDIINEKSFISLTPTSSTGNQTLYLESVAEGYAIVKMDKVQNIDVSFLWKVDNTDVYDSML